MNQPQIILILCFIVLKTKNYWRTFPSSSIIPLFYKFLNINLSSSKRSISAFLSKISFLRYSISFARDEIDSAFFFILAASTSFDSFSFLNRYFLRSLCECLYLLSTYENRFYLLETIEDDLNIEAIRGSILI